MNAFMEAAIKEAEEGKNEGGFPVGAVLVHDGRIIGRGRNRRVQDNSVILHAETDALENAGPQPPSIYRGSTLYTTLSPCPMCSGAILFYGIPRVVIGENVNFMGDETRLMSAGVDVKVLQHPGCIALMTSRLI